MPACLIRSITNSLYSLYTRPIMVPLGNLRMISNGFILIVGIKSKRKTPEGVSDYFLLGLPRLDFSLTGVTGST